MGAQLAGPGDWGEAYGQEGFDFAAKSFDGAEIGGKAMGDDPVRRNSLVREPQRRALRDARAHGRARAKRRIAGIGVGTSMNEAGGRTS